MKPSIKSKGKRRPLPLPRKGTRKTLSKPSLGVDDEDSTVSDTGKGAYFSAPSESHEFVSTGCALLDCVMGGGYVLGRVTNIVGDRSTGKTLLAMEGAANFLKVYPTGKVLYVETESCFDVNYAEQGLGISMKKVDLRQGVDTVEELFDELTKFLTAKSLSKPAYIVVDSLDALTDQAETERGISDGSYGTGKAKKMSELFRRLIRKLEQHRATLIIISQVRDAIGVTFGRKTKRTGGRALDFYAAQVMFLAQKEVLKKTISGAVRPIAVEIRIKMDKNKIGLPFRECVFPIRFGYGIDDVTASLDWLQEVKRLDEVGLTKTEVEKTIKQLDDLDRPDFEALRADISKAVRKVWGEIETEFLPRRKKYGNEEAEE